MADMFNSNHYWPGHNMQVDLCRLPNIDEKGLAKCQPFDFIGGSSGITRHILVARPTDQLSSIAVQVCSRQT
jgi:hypothetical protein